MSQEEETERGAHCNRCGSDTTHQIAREFEIAYKSMDGLSDSIVDMELKTYEILTCRGCNEVHFVHRETVYRGEPHDDEVEERRYPPIHKPPRPDWIKDLSAWSLLPDEGAPPVPFGLRDLLEQVYGARDQGWATLATAGMRIAIEMTLGQILGRKGEGKGLASLLGMACKEKLLNPECLSAAKAHVKEAGNAAAHRGYKPGDDGLSALIEDMEMILAHLLVEPRRQKERMARRDRSTASIPRAQRQGGGGAAGAENSPRANEADC